MADTQKLLQLSALLAQASLPFTQANPGQREFALGLLGSAQAGIQAEALKKAKKEEEKKSKGLFGGKIGSALGTAAGLALAPATGGASLALSGALGGAAGGALGSAISGGSASGADLMGYGVQGGLQGFSYGKAGELAQRSMEGTSNPVPVAAQVEGDIAKSMPDANRFMPDTMGGGGLASRVATPQAQVAMQSRPGPWRRFGDALAHTTGMAPAPYRVVRNPDGTIERY